MRDLLRADVSRYNGLVDVGELGEKSSLLIG